MFWKSKEVGQPVKEMIAWIKSGDNISISRNGNSSWDYYVYFGDPTSTEHRKIHIGFCFDRVSTNLQWIKYYEAVELWKVVNEYLVQPLEEQEDKLEEQKLVDERKEWCNWFKV